MYLRYSSSNLATWSIDNKYLGSTMIQHVSASPVKVSSKIEFRVPIDLLLNCLVQKEFAKKRKNGTVRGTAYLRWSKLKDAEIVIRYTRIVRSILKYYSCINKRSEL